MTKTFTYAEIFGGILGFGTAFDQLGGECVFVSELDKFAQQAITALGKGDVLHGDITKVKAEDIPQHDVLTAGFPCPAFSVAGSRGGMEYLCNDCSHEHLITFDEYVNGAKCPECDGRTVPKDIRGLLFFEVARVAQAKKPRVVLLENVKGLLSSSGGDVMRIITETLNSIGYTVDFELLNSKYFDVAQSRDRVFIVAIRDDIVEKVDWSDVKGNIAIPKAKRKLSESDSIKTFNFDWPEHSEVRTRLRDFLEDNVDEKYYLSEDKTAALVKQLEEKAEGIAVKEATTKGYAVAAEGDAVNIQFPNSKTRRGRVGRQMANTIEASGVNQGVVERVDAEQFSQGNGISYCLDANYSKGTAPGDVGKGRRTHVVEDTEPTIIDVSQMRGEASNIRTYEGIAPTITAREYKEPRLVGRIEVLGEIDIRAQRSCKEVYGQDGVSPCLTTMQGGYREPKIAEEVRPVLTPDRLEKRQNGRRFKDDGEEAFTLTSIDRHGVALGEYPRYRIRKLTPLECWRLQGFSDDAHEIVKQAGLSDSQRYKQAGNAVTVNVIRAIGERLLPYLDAKPTQD